MLELVVQASQRAAELLGRPARLAEVSDDVASDSRGPGYMAEEAIQEGSIEPANRLLAAEQAHRFRPQKDSRHRLRDAAPIQRRLNGLKLDQTHAPNCIRRSMRSLNIGPGLRPARVKAERRKGSLSRDPRNALGTLAVSGGRG